MLFAIFLMTLLSCKGTSNDSFSTDNFIRMEYSAESTTIVTGAERTALYYPLLKGKKVGMVVNQTSMVQGVHLLDTMLSLGVDVVSIFTPEHGFRGEADAGKTINSELDKATGIPIISLYGSHKKPNTEMLSGIEVMVFDIQDVGVRFYTYISTLHYVMESCAENNVPLIVLDRPNPNGHYIDGPVLQKKFSSFVGMHEVPVVYGMTIGEYAQLINGELWLDNAVKCGLTIVPCNNYSHEMTYDLPIKPSPNLPNLRSILLYPTLCFFEGTTCSIGRGTESQFQIVGHPSLKEYDFSFTPLPKPGAQDPKNKGKLCYGKSFVDWTINDAKKQTKIDIELIIDFYKAVKNLNELFFLENKFFDKLAGSDSLREQIMANKTAEEIRDSWKADIENFKIVREKYLLYP